MRRDTRIVAAAIAAIALVIAASAVLCTWAISEGASESWRLPFRIFCHGAAERSLAVFGEAMPICARCFAIYAGLGLGVAAFALRPPTGERGARLFLLAATLPIAIDGLTQAVGLRASTNGLRLATGAAAAIAFAFWALAAVEHGREKAIPNS
ncbi:MAG TPA: DUF2085 domain-containing protein [Thermoanaerobaculia bacterium]|nr:DUF2085 domain-containing protein [Thermoanaerobaculia bacterium]